MEKEASPAAKEMGREGGKESSSDTVCGTHTFQSRPAPYQVTGRLHSPNVQAREHGSGAASKHPDSEEHDQQRRAEHHLPCISGRIPDGQGKSHGTTQA